MVDLISVLYGVGIGAVTILIGCAAIAVSRWKKKLDAIGDLVKHEYYGNVELYTRVQNKADASLRGRVSALELQQEAGEQS